MRGKDAGSAVVAGRPALLHEWGLAAIAAAWNGSVRAVLVVAAPSSPEVGIDEVIADVLPADGSS